MQKGKRMLPIVTLILIITMITASSFSCVKATQDSSGFPSITVESYTINGETTYYSSGSSIPVGAVIDFRVWVDMYNTDPVKLAYGDGTADTYSFNGAFSHDFYHSYSKAAVYAPEAYMPTDSGTFTGFPSQPVTIGGSSNNGNSGNNGVSTVTSNPLDALVNGVVIILSGIGGVFGFTRSQAAGAGVVVVVVVFTVFLVVMGQVED